DNYNIKSTMADPDKKYLLQEAMKFYAEEAKNQLSFTDHADIGTDADELGVDEDGEDMELDLIINQTDAFEVMRPYFQKAVNICKTVLKRNHISGDQLDKLILVGGPTHSPLIRQMLREQVTQNVDTSIDPMTAVAVGAALYASTIDAEVDEKEIEVGTIKLELGYESTSVETLELVTVKLSEDSPLDKVWVEFFSADKSWSSGKTEIDKTGNVVDVNLVESKANMFSVIVYDVSGNALPCFPTEFTIIQGTKVMAAPLPYNIGIAVWGDVKKRAVFRMAEGLEKNKPVPTVGIVNDLKTTSRLRPGVSTDIVKIPVYQVDDFNEAKGRTAALYEYIADVIITGDDVDELIPEDSPVDLTLKVDTSEQMTLEAHFLASDIMVEKRLDTGKKQSIEEADRYVKEQLYSTQWRIDKLHRENIPTDELQKDLDMVKAEAENSSEKKAVLQHFKEVLRKIEDIDDKTAWDRLEKRLREKFAQVEKAQGECGNDKTALFVSQLRSQTDQAIRMKDVDLGHEVLSQLEKLYFNLTYVYQCIYFIQDSDRDFTKIQWKDSARARQLINKGLEECNNQPTEVKLRPIVFSILDLMPDEYITGNYGGLLK
ncbi:MAG: Hsp70 family protein, partial [Prevotella sp.]|nr:Hsp70 family protein [Prevotella sp.]